MSYIRAIKDIQAQKDRAKIFQILAQSGVPSDPLKVLRKRYRQEKSHLLPLVLAAIKQLEILENR
jgi:hypothetical protein